jgi:hypothetical protein
MQMVQPWKVVQVLARLALGSSPSFWQYLAVDVLSPVTSGWLIIVADGRGPLADPRSTCAATLRYVDYVYLSCLPWFGRR